jgi:hypothetical protein
VRASVREICSQRLVSQVLKSSLIRGSPDAIMLKAMTRLARRAELYPRCFRISPDLELLGNKEAYCGGYGLVWKAILDGQIVAVKILRQSAQDDPHCVLKVPFTFDQLCVSDWTLFL